MKHKWIFPLAAASPGHLPRHHSRKQDHYRVLAGIAFLLASALPASAATGFGGARSSLDAPSNSGAATTAAVEAVPPVAEGRMSPRPAPGRTETRLSPEILSPQPSMPLGPGDIDRRAGRFEEEMATPDDTDSDASPEQEKGTAAPKEPAPAKPGPIAGEAADHPASAARVVVESGMLKNPAHGFRFPVPRGWRLQDSSTSEEIVLTTSACEECVLRVVVSRESNSVEETAAAIRKEVSSDAGARLVGEEPIKVAHKEAWTLVKEVPVQAPSGDAKAKTSPAGDHVVKVRYVTFNNAGDTYYLVLRAPGDRFAEDDVKFEGLLKKFHFD